MKNIGVAFALFLTWTISYSLGNIVLILALLLAGYGFKDNRSEFGLLLLILIISYLNLFTGFFTNKIIDSGASSFQLYFPYLGLLLGARVLAGHINVKVIGILVWLVAIECMAVVYQYSYGLTGFFYNSYEANDQLSDMLYYTRPNGFSTNSSIVGQKLLFAFWTLLNLREINGKYRYLVWMLLFAGMLLVFNRTVFVALSLSILFSKKIFSKKTKGLILVIGALFVSFFFGTLSRQFLRGADNLNLEELTRYRVYSNGLDYINHNPLLGNNGVKYFYLENGRYFHLHNSFLETAASNGLVVFFIILILLFYLLYQRNLYVLPLMLYSFLQFGIFWGISFLDILLFVNHEKISDKSS